MKLNLGSADRYVDGWHNVDHEPCPHYKDETVDLTGPLPWPEKSISHAYAGHIVEHVTKEQCAAMLRNLRPLMVEGGQLMVVAPDIEIAEEIGTGWFHTMDQLRFGATRWPGDEHQWECTTAQVLDLVRDAGWREITDVGITNVSEFWPVIDRIPQWQLAVSAVA